MSKIKVEWNGPKRAKKCVALAHGAGESWNSAFMDYFAEQIAGLEYLVARFEFPYMADRASTGRRRPPDSQEVLCAAWKEVIAQVRTKVDQLVIGGKSMGGRMASLVADEVAADGLLCLGYPFHPTGKPEKLRVEHLATLVTQTLIVQGDMDPFGSREEVESYQLSQQIKIHWVPDGDHSYGTGRGTDRTLDMNLKNAMRAIEPFLFTCLRAS